MTHRFSKLAGIIVFFGCLIFLTGTGRSQEYTDYSSNSNSGSELLFTLMFDGDNFGYSYTNVDATTRFIFDRSDVKVKGHTVTADGKVLIDSDGFHISGKIFSFDELTRVNVDEDERYTIISFYTSDPDSRRTTRIRRGNRIDPFAGQVVADDEFIRGVVFSVTADIEIYGEVNKDVVSLFGDIFVGPEAVVRGSVATVAGRIDLAGDASVYGDIRSGRDSRIGRHHRFRKYRGGYASMVELELDGGVVSYNRVDGLTFGLALGFEDIDSVLPKVWAGGSYAFEAEAWRYELGLEQTLLRNPALVIGGKAYRRLLSDDDWLLSTGENTTFAMGFGEDYKDYYLAEGGKAFVRARPFNNLLVESGLKHEETSWLDAERDLWSVFGGDKKFSPNFGAVDSASRQAGIGAIDTSSNAMFYGTIEYQTLEDDTRYYYSSWAVGAEFENSSPRLKSDFDYTRYRLSATRHQRLNRNLMAIVRGVYGGSNGILPMHRRFYLGGLGTLYGYDHKEYSGRYFWLTNFEYRVSFPRSDLAVSVMWDAGQVSESSSFGDAEVKHSLGVALYVGSDFKIGLAKRLDRSYNDKAQVFARFAYSL
jgi:hypothetical protein